MSEASKAARKAMHEKIARLMADPHEKVDASSWTPPEPLNADVQTGERPVSPRQYKRGGKVQGEFAKLRADRKMRRAGGRLPDMGSPHDAGRAAYASGASNPHPSGTMLNTQWAQGWHHAQDGASDREGSFARAPLRRKSGGRALTANSLINRDVKEANEGRDGTKHVGGFKRGGSPKHDDTAQDMKLVRKMVEKKALKPKERAKGGSVSDGEMEGTRPTGGRMARKDGGRAGKGKMNVNIVIAAGGRSPGGDQEMPPAAMMSHPQGVPVPASPPQGAAPMPVPVQMPPGAPPPGMMPRKSGGRTMKVARDMAEHGGGGGGGLGRLEKIRAYGDQR